MTLWRRRKEKAFTMEALYMVSGLTKQGFHQWKNRFEKKAGYRSNVIQILEQVRTDHPGMGIREIWRFMSPQIGRDEFERIAKEFGYQVIVKRNKMITTNSKGVTRFDNLIKEMKLTGVNQVWVSDITYYRLGNRFYYMTLIMDLYSRMVIGYSLSTTLKTTETTQVAIDYVIRTRLSKNVKTKTILHSDGGGQYYESNFRKTLKANNIETSMCYECYENPNAERLNGIIKNYYISRWHPKSYKELGQYLVKACFNYNQRPHGSLGKKSPFEFEGTLA
jgi:transposase InsO family protein